VRVLSHVGKQLVNGGEGHAGDGVGSTIVDGDAAGVGIGQGSARERNVRHVTGELIALFRTEDIEVASFLHDPRLLVVKKRYAEAINEAVAGVQNAVINHQPAFIGLDRNRAGADLLGLPAGVTARAEDIAVLAPIRHVRALAVEDVAERGVTGVGRTAQHCEVAVDLLREHNAVAVIRQVSVLHLIEGLKVFDKICQGNKEGGVIANMDIPDRFRWLTAVKSSCIQVSRPHPGFSTDLDNTLERLFKELVL